MLAKHSHTHSVFSPLRIVRLVSYPDFVHLCITIANVRRLATASNPIFISAFHTEAQTPDLLWHTTIREQSPTQPLG